jgi:hypothetical protein
VAASLRKDPSLKVNLVSGHYGEFTVLVDDEEVLSGGALAVLGVLPSLRKIRDTVELKRRTE